MHWWHDKCLPPPFRSVLQDDVIYDLYLSWCWMIGNSKPKNSRLNEANVTITKNLGLLLDQLDNNDVDEANIIASVKAHVGVVRDNGLH